MGRESTDFLVDLWKVSCVESKIEELNLTKSNVFVSIWNKVSLKVQNCGHVICRTKGQSGISLYPIVHIIMQICRVAFPINIRQRNDVFSSYSFSLLNIGPNLFAMLAFQHDQLVAELMITLVSSLTPSKILVFPPGDDSSSCVSDASNANEWPGRGQELLPGILYLSLLLSCQSTYPGFYIFTGHFYFICKVKKQKTKSFHGFTLQCKQHFNAASLCALQALIRFIVLSFVEIHAALLQ